MNCQRLYLGVRTAWLALLMVSSAAQATTLYVSVYNEVVRIDSNGGVTPFASGLAAPSGLALDGAGNLYVANYGDNTIMKYTPGGVPSVFATTGLDHPQAMAFDQAGNLYVANTGPYSSGNYLGYVEKYTPQGVGSVFGSSSSGLNGPLLGLAFDKAGNLFASSTLDYIFKVNAAGAVSLFAATYPNIPEGLAFDSAGNLDAACGGNNAVLAKYSPTGASLGASPVDVNACGLAIDSANNLYVTDYTISGNIEEIAPNGATSIIAQGLAFPKFIVVVPEPSTGAVLALGAAALLGLRRRRANQLALQ